MDVILMPLGKSIEEGNFWKSIHTTAYSSDWIYKVKLVVLPAYVESSPRMLLKAIAAGIPVITTPECGLMGYRGVKEVPAGDAEHLRREISGALSI
jgi:hypothetical protein